MPDPTDDSTDLSDAIADAARSPLVATGDTGSVTSHSLKDLIAADQYLTAKRAQASASGGTTSTGGIAGLTISKVTPGGAA